MYWEDLRRNPGNGFALRGLLQALRAQDRAEDAGLVEQRLAAAWGRSDAQLASSR